LHGFCFLSLTEFGACVVVRQPAGLSLRREYPDPEKASSTTWTADQRRAFTIHHPELTPRNVADAYPAHLHNDCVLATAYDALDRGYFTFAIEECCGRTDCDRSVINAALMILRKQAMTNNSNRLHSIDLII
jgi:hypothetical protein